VGCVHCGFCLFCAGSWLKKHPEVREKIVLATKVGNRADASDCNAHGLSRCHIMASVERSLSRLSTTHIDLYQVGSSRS